MASPQPYPPTAYSYPAGTTPAPSEPYRADAPSVPHYGNDGFGYLNATPPVQYYQAPTYTTKARPAQQNKGNWKVMSLVLFFLFWMFAASVFLFLYMDRYLFW
ncbi:MAG: hypothetical protein RhofKO_31470 [Rhodothermales bacterium]